MEALKSIGLFLLAGLGEIDGGHLVGQWLREGKGTWVGLIGAVAWCCTELFLHCNPLLCQA